ncbi:tRNA pseudouridine synthase A domain protein [Bacteroides fragilis str. S6L5]|nr:tRNA pseudouridine synthase A domain protein [Bacteroides fragilis str. S6L5]
MLDGKDNLMLSQFKKYWKQHYPALLAVLLLSRPQEEQMLVSMLTVKSPISRNPIIRHLHKLHK